MAFEDRAEAGRLLARRSRGCRRVGVSGSRPFFRAEWRNLAILNFEVRPSVLEPLLPRGLELDCWQDRHYVSVIGFQFLHLRFLGMPILFHQSFDEVNLRFYVRRRAPDGWRHGVVFIKELVSRRAVALAARIWYNEPYVALPMRHDFTRTPIAGAHVRSLTYAWTLGRREHTLRLTTSTLPLPTQQGCEEAFFAERYWGYSMQRNGALVEYYVERPRWSVAAASEAQLVCDIAAVYGEAFAQSLGAPPTSAFFAEGSAVALSSSVALETH